MTVLSTLITLGVLDVVLAVWLERRTDPRP